jgi:hypothetical protein
MALLSSVIVGVTAAQKHENGRSAKRQAEKSFDANWKSQKRLAGIKIR